MFRATLAATFLTFLLFTGCSGGGSVSAAPTPSTPVASISPTSLAFASTAVGSTSAAQTVNIINTGGASLTITSIVLNDTSNFAMTSTCGSAAFTTGAGCALSISFKPQSAATLMSSITVTDNASGSPQTIGLSGTGATAAITRTLYAFPESDNSITPLYAMINGAKTTIDMTMYELVDTTFSADLVAACGRGVKVRVILDQSLEKSSNTAAFGQLNTAGANCSAVFSNTVFQATHQKTITVDGTQTAILSLNLTSRYYNDTRDFALIENDANDISAIEATFNSDYAAGTTYNGTIGTSDFSYAPPGGDDLIWSPTTATTDLLGIINGATKTLLVENEEMSASNIVSALESACQRGVAVNIAMTDTGSYYANYTALEAAGCGVHIGADNDSTTYIHGKALLADFGLPTQAVYMGSINFSNASMTENRELGLYISDAAAVQLLHDTIAADYAAFPVF